MNNLDSRLRGNDGQGPEIFGVTPAFFRLTIIFLFYYYKGLYLLASFKPALAVPIHQEMTDKGKCVPDEWTKGITFSLMN